MGRSGILTMTDWKGRMSAVVEQLADQFRVIRSGTVSAGLVGTIAIRRSGRRLALSCLSTIKTQGDRILLTPFDRTLVPEIIKALADARLNAYALDPATICLTAPAPSVEQRREIVGQIKKRGEEARVAIRLIRQDARRQIAARGRGSERAVQEATDEAIAEIERLVRAKIAEIER